ncbi:hypothetical protein Lal_00008053 [Lupinus albus]|nr:hypothetical protein Lal_00008053 [Lupinus albus]
MAHAAALPSLSLARRQQGAALAHRFRQPVHPGLHRHTACPALSIEVGGGRDERVRPAPDAVRHADGAGLRGRTLRRRRLRQSAQHRVRARGTGRDARAGRKRVRAPAPPVAALPPRPPHRRGDQGDRTRHQEHRHDALLHAVQHRAHGAAARDRGGDLLLHLRLGPCRGDGGGDRRLHLGHAHHHRMAHASAREDEPARWAGAVPRGRFAAQLRNGEVFRRGSARGSPLCAGDARLRRCRGKEREQPGPAQHRAGGGGQPADGRGDGVDGRRLGQGGIHRRPAGVRADLSDSAVPAARHARHGLSHDPAGPDRHGRNVPPDRYGGRSRRRTGRARAGCAPALGGLRQRGVRLRSRPYHPARPFVRRAGRQPRRHRRPFGRGQVHHRPADVPLLRSVDGPHPDRRAGYRRRHAGVPARRDRHRAAGFGAVQRHHRLQRGLWPRRRDAGGRGSRRARGRHIRFHRPPAAGFRYRSGRTRPQAFGRRKAARGHRPHAGQEPADPAVRRSDQRARHRDRAGHPRHAAHGRGQPHHDLDRAPPVDDRGFGPHLRAGSGSSCGKRKPPGTAAPRRALCRDVGAPGGGKRRGQRGGGVRGRAAPAPAFTSPRRPRTTPPPARPSCSCFRRPTPATAIHRAASPAPAPRTRARRRRGRPCR